MNLVYDTIINFEKNELESLKMPTTFVDEKQNWPILLTNPPKQCRVRCCAICTFGCGWWYEKCITWPWQSLHWLDTIYAKLHGCNIVVVVVVVA